MEAQSPHVGMVWKFGEWDDSSSTNTMTQFKIRRYVSNSPSPCCRWAYGSRSEPPSHIIGVNVSCGSSSPWWRVSNLNGCWYLERGRGKLVPGVGDRSDESRFQLCSDDHRRRVWRRPEQRADPGFTIARHRGPEPGVMVWSSIYFDSWTPLVIIKGTLKAQRSHTLQAWADRYDRGESVIVPKGFIRRIHDENRRSLRFSLECGTLKEKFKTTVIITVTCNS
ncbi:transposable element Tc1 transposase [Trichonephila clavipes]|nr:transposable element Tc1 transposase [Trichonephila clavipes]